MKFRDRRTALEQAKSGLKIAGAMLVTFAICILLAGAYAQIVNVDGTHSVLRGWLLMAASAAITVATARYWRHWFFLVAAYLGMRSSLGMLLGWFSPRGFVFIIFPVLILTMTALSFRFAKARRIQMADRVALVIAAACLFGAIVGFLSPQPRVTALGFAAVGDLALGLSWMHSIRRSRNSSKRIEHQSAAS